MTTYGHHFTVRPLFHATRRIWAALAVLVLAGVVTLIVVLSSRGSDDTTTVRPQINTNQNHGKAAPDCRPADVVQPC